MDCLGQWALVIVQSLPDTVYCNFPFNLIQCVVNKVSQQFLASLALQMLQYQHKYDYHKRNQGLLHGVQFLTHLSLSLTCLCPTFTTRDISRRLYQHSPFCLAAIQSFSTLCFQYSKTSKATKLCNINPWELGGGAPPPPPARPGGGINGW